MVAMTDVEHLISELKTWIEVNTTWESYGYYGPLVYTDGLLSEIDRLKEKYG
jgi:hypothetical protein